MEMQELEIIIRRDGTANVAVHGVAGNHCLGVTKNLEEAVGTVDTREFTAAYYEEDISGRESVVQRVERK